MQPARQNTPLSHVPVAAVRALSGPSAVRWSIGAITNWLAIIASAALYQVLPNPLTLIVGVFVVGTRQHALGVLVHDAAHYLAFKRRRLADLFTNILCSYPLLFPVQGYRRFHFEHHKLLGTTEDPEKVALQTHPHDWTLPMPPRRLIRVFLKDLSGLQWNSLRTLFESLWSTKSRAPHLIGVVITHGTVITALLVAGCGQLYLLLWLLPMATVGAACFRLRSIGEHWGMRVSELMFTHVQVDPLKSTRSTVVSGSLQRWLFFPHGCGYHLEHHIYPSVSCWQLSKLHKVLRETPEVAEQMHICYGVRGLLAEVTRNPDLT